MNLITHLEFSCPLRIVSEANTSQRWTAKRDRRLAQQLEISVVMHNALAGQQIQSPYVVKLVRIGPNRLDQDNLANGMKGIQDAIAAKLGVNDGDETKVTWIYDQEPCKIRKYAVRVEINSR